MSFNTDSRSFCSFRISFSDSESCPTSSVISFCNRLFSCKTQADGYWRSWSRGGTRPRLPSVREALPGSAQCSQGFPSSARMRAHSLPGQQWPPPCYFPCTCSRRTSGTHAKVLVEHERRNPPFLTCAPSEGTWLRAQAEASCGLKGVGMDG